MESEAYEELYRLEPDHWWYRGMRQITASLLSSRLNVQANLRILDAGCGVGGNLTALARLGATLGVDYSPIAVAYANEIHYGRLARATIELLPFASDCFDLVTSFDVLYCREVDDDVMALRELARVAQPGGYVLVRVPALSVLRGPHDVIVHGHRRYTASELQQKMIQAGLRPIQVTYVNSLLMPLIFVIRQIQNIGVRLGSHPKSDVRATPKIINGLLSKILGLEAHWAGKGRSFPVGVSVLCLATKPNSAEKISSIPARQACNEMGVVQ